MNLRLIVLARARQKVDGSVRWLIRVDAGLRPDITVAVRMDAENRNPLDYYLLFFRLDNDIFES